MLYNSSVGFKSKLRNMLRNARFHGFVNEFVRYFLEKESSNVHTVRYCSFE